MPPHSRKRTRINSKQSDNSVTTIHSSDSNDKPNSPPNEQNNMTEETNTLIADWHNAGCTFVKHTPEICRLHCLNNLKLPENTFQYMALFLENSLELLSFFLQIRQTVEGPSVEKIIKDAYKLYIQSTEAGIQTTPPSPPPEPPVQPTYASVACMAEPTANTAPAITPNPSKPKWGTPPQGQPSTHHITT
ncbi:hypothetical protein BN14_09130 [Rhizoctonia solani AG-1 IB]|uniref:Uncharacterized protein n=1 Tax=Thanatephorus cucumeris (strain AG1-IB / isolate 7/3/14) TaxID=1108050 RepID=M5CFV3_THACB|nr:hypothetical protein BN14_09130 [Rhizoctonia solani AG-1 IB]